MKKLTIYEAEYIAHRFAKSAFKHFDEPMPDFATRFPGKLESRLEQPFIYPYRFLYQKAAYMFYLMIKNHPFANGNKRMAVVITLVFLEKNGKWLNIGTMELYNIARVVAQSDREDMEKIVKQVTIIFKKYLVDF